MDEEPHRYSWPLLTFKSFTLSTFCHFHSFSPSFPLPLCLSVFNFVSVILNQVRLYVCVCVCVDHVRPLWPGLCAYESQTVCEVTTATTVTVSVPPPCNNPLIRASPHLSKSLPIASRPGSLQVYPSFWPSFIPLPLPPSIPSCVSFFLSPTKPPSHTDLGKLSPAGHKIVFPLLNWFSSKSSILITACLSRAIWGKWSLLL